MLLFTATSAASRRRLRLACDHHRAWELLRMVRRVDGAVLDRRIGDDVGERAWLESRWRHAQRAERSSSSARRICVAVARLLRRRAMLAIARRM